MGWQADVHGVGIRHYDHYGATVPQVASVALTGKAATGMHGPERVLALHPGRVILAATGLY